MEVRVANEPIEPLGREGRILAVDFGTVRLGFAVCDSGQQFSSPFENYTRRSIDEDARHICRIVDEEQIRWLLVGLPIHLDGRENAKSQESREFGAWLHQLTNLPVAFFDERMTSKEAEAQLIEANLSSKQRKQRRDMLAAQLLLAAYLESDRDTSSAVPEGLDD